MSPQMGASLKMGASLNKGILPCRHLRSPPVLPNRLKSKIYNDYHRGGERSARIARSTQATALHAHDEANCVTIINWYGLFFPFN